MKRLPFLLAALLAAAPAYAQHDLDPEAMQAMEEQPVTDAPELAPGSIEVLVLGPKGQPEPGVRVRIGAVESTIAKGDSRKEFFAESDANGIAHFAGLATTSSFAYRPSVERGGGKFMATPFRLPNEHGMRVKLRVYPTSMSLEGLRIGTTVAVYMEPKDDRIQFEEMVQVLNLSSTAWLPGKEDRFVLPEGVTGFQAQEGMTDTALEKDEDKETGRTYVRLRGTFGPGEHMMVFSYQVPSEKARFEAIAAFPPRVAQVRVMAAKSGALKLDVPGFPAVKEQRLNNGLRVWGTEVTYEKAEGNPSSVTMVLSGLPSRGIWPAVVTSFATVLMLLSAGYAYKRREGRMTDEEFNELLAVLRADLRALEASREAGEVGPETFALEKAKLEERLARALLRTGRAVDKSVESSV